MTSQQKLGEEKDTIKCSVTVRDRQTKILRMDLTNTRPQEDMTKRYHLHWTGWRLCPGYHMLEKRDHRANYCGAVGVKIGPEIPNPGSASANRSQPRRSQNYDYYQDYP